MKDQNTPTNTLREQINDILRIPHNKKPERFTIATQIRHSQVDLLMKLLDSQVAQAVNKARIDELYHRQSDLAWACGYTKDQPFLANQFKIVKDRIKELETPNQVEGETNPLGDKV